MADFQGADAGLRELALFAGAGGGILGGTLLGWRTVCAVEYDAYAASVLCARQNDGLLAPFPIWDDVRTFDGRPWRGRVDVVAGGFPCQDISAAGKGEGITGERSGLWVEMARIIGEVRPRYAFVENSPMLTVRGLGVVLGDLAALGFDARWGVLGAADVGAPHLRERIWIVADARSSEREQRRDADVLGRWQGEAEQAGVGCGDVANASGRRRGGPGEWEGKQPWRAEAECAGEDVADAYRKERRASGMGQNAGADGRNDAQGDGLCHGGHEVPNTTHPESVRRWDWAGWWCGSAGDDGRENAEGTDWWHSEPDVGRVADGVAARVDRLRCIGNGQVPQCAALAWRLLGGE